jgi:hypothetical protein
MPISASRCKQAVQSTLDVTEQIAAGRRPIQYSLEILCGVTK